MNKKKRKKAAERLKRKLLARLRKYEKITKKTKIHYDILYHSLKTKKERNEYLINKWKLKEHFEFLDETVKNPEKFR